MADLCVKSRLPKDREAGLIIKRAFELGLNAIAWNHTVFGKPTQANISQLPKGEHQLPPADASVSRVLRKLAFGGEGDNAASDTMRQLQRLTVVVDEMNDAQVLNLSNDLLSGFDLVAATPTNGKVFGYLCKESDVDIISLDFSRPLGFSISKKTVEEAVSRGIYFEIRCSPCLQQPAARKEILAGTKQLVRVLRGRNIVLSSGAESNSQLRGPQDLMSTGQILHLTEQCSRAAVDKAWRAVMHHALSRRRRHLPMSLTPYSTLQQTLMEERRIKEEVLLSGRKRAREDDSDDESSSEDVPAVPVSEVLTVFD